MTALDPNDPELDYTLLDGIHNGTEAMIAFPKMEFMSEEERTKTQESFVNN